jgi:two-component system, response regulator
MPGSAYTRHVLVVEDLVDDEKLTLAALRKCNVPITVHVARDGKQAIDMLFGEHPMQPMPDLIFLDIKLPKVNGIEVLQRLRKEPQTQNVPVVMLTSSDDNFDIDKTYKLGANSYIRKSVDPDKYMEEVRLAGIYWTTINISGRV